VEANAVLGVDMHLPVSFSASRFLLTLNRQVDRSHRLNLRRERRAMASTPSITSTSTAAVAWTANKSGTDGSGYAIGG
jgi:hypothetical protein